MKQYKSMSKSEKKVANACHNGWWLSGTYEVSFGGHRRRFTADSKGILFNQASRWYETHIKHHADDHVLVRCIQPWID